MEKLLIITPQIIIPPVDGGKMCMYNHIDIFSSSFNVSVVMGNSDDISQDLILSQQYLKKSQQVIMFPRINKKIKKSGLLVKGIECLKWFLSGKPRQAQTIESTKNQQQVTEYAIKNKIDIICLETPYASELIDIEQVKKNGIKVITIEHNVEFHFLKDCLDNFGKLAWLELNRARKYEQRILSQSNLVIGISPIDVIMLQKTFNLKNIKYLPTYLREKNVLWENNKSTYIIFCGSLSFNPNYHGMKWFLENVFMKYIKIYPNIHLKITGKVDRKIQKELSQYSNVEFTGFLSNEELEKTILKTFFAVVPILKGSGIKMKLLEALSYGVPTITTVHGADGIPYEEEAPYLIGKNEDEILQHMISLTENSHQRKKLGKLGSCFFESIYASPENIRNWISCINYNKY